MAAVAAYHIIRHVHMYYHVQSKAIVLHTKPDSNAGG